MTHESDSIDSELSALRAEARQGPGVGIEERVLARVEASIPLLAGAAAAGVSSELGSGTRGAGAGVTGKLWLVGMFALGGGVGAGATAMLDRDEPPRVIYVDRIVTAKPANVADAPALRAETASSEQTPPPRPVEQKPNSAKFAPLGRPPVASGESKTQESARTAPIESPSASLANLAEQQALLDQARAALGNGNGPAALEAVRAHAARFPESVLAEEREAIAVKALAHLGRRTEARTRLELFENRFPRSPLLPSLRTTVGKPVTETLR
jgi:hypothetical protein